MLRALFLFVAVYVGSVHSNAVSPDAWANLELEDMDLDALLEDLDSEGTSISMAYGSHAVAFSSSRRRSSSSSNSESQCYADNGPGEPRGEQCSCCINEKCAEGEECEKVLRIILIVVIVVIIVSIAVCIFCCKKNKSMCFKPANAAQPTGYMQPMQMQQMQMQNQMQQQGMPMAQGTVIGQQAVGMPMVQAQGQPAVAIAIPIQQPQPQQMMVAIPDGVFPGQTISVQTPNGLMSVAVPPGAVPGQQITIQY